MISGVVRRGGLKGRYGASRGETRSSGSRVHSVAAARTGRSKLAGLSERFSSAEWKHLHGAEMRLHGRPLLAVTALLASVALLQPSPARGFNLDTSHVLRKDGEAGSLFGFSLAMHRQLHPEKRM